MSQFQDLAELLDPRLPLPIRGKTYYVPSPSVKVGLRAQATVAVATKVKLGEDVSPDDVASLQLDDADEADFTASMLGPVFAEMQADDLPWEYVRHAAKTVFMWLVSDRDEAAKVWSNLGKSRKVPTDRKPKKPATKSGSGGRTKKATSRSSSTRHSSRPTPASAGSAS